MEIISTTNIYRSDQIEQQRLSVLYTTEGLCSFTRDRSNTLASIDWTSVQLLDNNTALKELYASFDQVEIFYDSAMYSLMPRDLFLYGKEAHYLMHTGLTHTDIVMTDQLKSQEIVNSFAIDVQDNLNCRQLFKTSQASHLLSAIIRQIPQEFNGIYMYIYQTKAYAVRMNMGKISYVSRFSVQEVSDVLYGLSICTQEVDDPSSLPICLGGFITQHSKVYHAIKVRFPKTNLHYQNLHENAAVIL